MNDLFFKGAGLPRNKVLIGILGEENEGAPGTFAFTSTDGFSVVDANLLITNADVDDNVSFEKPRPGTPCVALTSDNGAHVIIIGYTRQPVFDEGGDETPLVGDPPNVDTSGDKIFSTAGGAFLALKRGGAVQLEGGSGGSIIINPANRTMSYRTGNKHDTSDGYQSSRGRKAVPSTEPETLHQDSFHDTVESRSIRVRVRHGDIDGGVRRELEVASLNRTKVGTTGQNLFRERHNKDGSWETEGPEYKWGGSTANENAVLGKKLVGVLDTFIDIVQRMQVGTAMGPSTPALLQFQKEFTDLRQTLSDEILSEYIFISKTPSDPGPVNE